MDVSVHDRLIAAAQTAMRPLRDSIRASQAAFRLRLQPVAQRQAAVLAESIRLLYWYARHYLDRDIVEFLGGHDAVVADLGIAYVRACRRWFARSRGYQLSTFVINECRWETIRLLKERQLIHVPRPGPEPKYGLSDKGLRMRELFRAYAAEAKRIHYFHGREGVCEELTYSDTHLHERLDDKEDLANALRQLPERRRQVLHLRFHEDLSLAECGRHLGVTKETVRRTEYVAITKLRKAILLARTTRVRPGVHVATWFDDFDAT